MKDMNNTDKSEFLGKEKIFPLLIKMAAPAAAGMLVQALYNIVDTIFVGRGVGSLAIGALSLVFPIQMIVASIAMALGIGTASIVSRRLGEKRFDDASKAVGTGYTSMLAGTFILTATLVIFMRPILGFFGTTDVLMPLTSEYTKWVSIGFFFFAFSSFASTMARAEGNSKGAMIGMMVGAVLNCMLDPLFIFGFDLGVMGAAIATSISQMVSALYFISIYVRKKNTVKIRPEYFRIDTKILKESVILGIPPFIQNAGMSLLVLIVNNSLGHYGGEEAIVNYGMSNRFMSVLIMPIIGIAQGFQPIAGYNIGAKNYDRVKQSLKTAIITGLSVTMVGYSIAMIFPQACMGLFTSDTAIIESSARVLRIVMVSIPLVAVQFIGISYFQAVGKAKQSMLLGLSRQLLLFLPVLIILPLIIGLDGVWGTFPVADTLSSVLTYILLIVELKKLGRADEERKADMETEKDDYKNIQLQPELRAEA